jgi:glucose-6-phosphate isomerase
VRPTEQNQESMQHSIGLDLQNLLADRVGKHGLSSQDLAAIDARILELRQRITTERAQGLHGYLGLPANSTLMEMMLQVCQPRLGRFHTLVVLGIGGSSLGLAALVEALEVSGRRQVDLHVVDNTDPSLYASVMARVDLEDTVFVAVSKSGGTVETVIALGFFVERIRQAGLDLKRHLVVVTDPANGPLRAFADEHGLDVCEIPPEVGGRFSVLTPAGLAPATLMHLDASALLEGAGRSVKLSARGPVEQDWPARLGLIAAELCKRGKSQLVFMPYSSRLRCVSNWFVQLWDESLGKASDVDGKTVNAGQTAIPASGATDQHAQLQLFLEGPNDKLLLFARVERHDPDLALGEFEWDKFGAGFVRGKTLGQVLAAQQRGTAEACAQRKRPNATLVLPQIDAATVGELLMGLQIATTYAAYAFGVNAYDQPSVELGKKISRDMLS